MGRGSRRLERVYLRRIAKQRDFGRAKDLAGTDRALTLPGKQEGITTVAPDNIGSLELELRRAPDRRGTEPHIGAVQIAKQDASGQIEAAFSLGNR